jgi:hypothetical protein
MRSLNLLDRELHEGLNMVILCLDEHYTTTLAHWLR